MLSNLRIAWMVSMLIGVAHAQTTERVCVALSGTHGGNGESRPNAISPDGRFVLFTSDATNLTSAFNGVVHNVFVRDRATSQTTCASIAHSGGVSDGDAAGGSITPDGRYVAFASEATNTVTGDTNDTIDVFVRDLWSGQTTRVSVAPSGGQSDGDSFDPTLSADGRYVAFTSTASNLVADDSNDTEDVFVHDRETGATIRASVTSSGAQAFADCWDASISADGRYVGFTSFGAFLVAGDTNSARDVFVHDRVSGQTTRASLDSSGLQGNSDSFEPRLSANGRYVAFRTHATNLAALNGTGSDIVLRDRTTGQTTLMSRSSAGVPNNGDCFSPAISDDGRFVAFHSGAYNLVADDTNAQVDVFVHDRSLAQTVRASITWNGAQVESSYCQDSFISADGRFVAFWSGAQSLVVGDMNHHGEAFVRDQGAGPITSFCAGDGTRLACPCANNGSVDHGCANSLFSVGARLTGFGVPSVGGDSVLLQAQDLSGNVCVFFQGDAQMPPTIIDDGLGCVTGAIIRLGTKSVANAASEYPSAGDLSVSVKGAVGPAGGARFYQAFYRNAAPVFCPPATTNRTNGLVISWSP